MKGNENMRKKIKIYGQISGELKEFYKPCYSEEDAVKWLSRERFKPIDGSRTRWTNGHGAFAEIIDWE